MATLLIGEIKHILSLITPKGYNNEGFIEHFQSKIYAEAAILDSIFQEFARGIYRLVLYNHFEKNSDEITFTLGETTLIMSTTGGRLICQFSRIRNGQKEILSYATEYSSAYKDVLGLEFVLYNINTSLFPASEMIYEIIHKWPGDHCEQKALLSDNQY